MSVEEIKLIVVHISKWIKKKEREKENIDCRNDIKYE